VERVEDLHEDALAAALELLDGLGAAVGADEDMVDAHHAAHRQQQHLLPAREVLQERACVAHRLLLFGVLREPQEDGAVVGRRRLDAKDGADEALVDAAVLQRKAPLLGRAHKGTVGEAEARGKLGHAKPAQAAVEAGARLGSWAARPCSFLIAGVSAWMVFVNLWPLRFTHALMSRPLATAPKTRPTQTRYPGRPPSRSQSRAGGRCKPCVHA